jgi:hypothetical protein
VGETRFGVKLLTASYHDILYCKDRQLFDIYVAPIPKYLPKKPIMIYSVKLAWKKGHVLEPSPCCE